MRKFNSSRVRSQIRVAENMLKRDLKRVEQGLDREVKNLERKIKKSF